MEGSLSYSASSSAATPRSAVSVPLSSSSSSSDGLPRWLPLRSVFEAIRAFRQSVRDEQRIKRAAALVKTRSGSLVVEPSTTPFLPSDDDADRETWSSVSSSPTGDNCDNVGKEGVGVTTTTTPIASRERLVQVQQQNSNSSPPSLAPPTPPRHQHDDNGGSAVGLPETSSSSPTLNEATSRMGEEPSKNPSAPADRQQQQQPFEVSPFEQPQIALLPPDWLWKIVGGAVAVWAFRSLRTFHSLLSLRYADVAYQVRRPDAIASRLTASKFLVGGGVVLPLGVATTLLFCRLLNPPSTAVRDEVRTALGGEHLSSNESLRPHGISLSAQTIIPSEKLLSLKANIAPTSEALRDALKQSVGKFLQEHRKAVAAVDAGLTEAKR